MVSLSLPDNPVSRTREDIINGFFPVFIIGNRDIPYCLVPEFEKSPVFRGKITAPVRHPPGFFPQVVENQDAGTEITTAEFRPAGMHRADAFIGCPLPEEGTGNGFFILVFKISEKVSFILVHGYHAFLAIRVPDPEFIGTDLLPYTDDLTHGTATVTTALTYKGHNRASRLPVGWFPGRKKHRAGVRYFHLSGIRIISQGIQHPGSIIPAGRDTSSVLVSLGSLQQSPCSSSLPG